MTDTTLTDGSPVTPEHRDIDPATGMQRGYVVMSAEERAKGFVRPVRDSYVHVGRPRPVGLRALTEQEARKYIGEGYVAWQPYPADRFPITGKFWTQREIDDLQRQACGAVTRMGRAIAETYARDPSFYSGTFCIHCRTHFPVGADGEFVWEGTDERVGT